MTPERELEILRAAVEVLRETGYGALTMDAVAAKGRCSKATLYRLWSTKPCLVAAGLRADKPELSAGIDTGSLRGDLLALCDQMLEHSRQDTLLISALAHASLLEPDLADALRQSFFEPEIERLREFLTLAVERGELAAMPTAVDLLPGLFLGSLIFRPLFGQGYADTALAHRFIDEIVLPVLRN